MGGRGFGRTRGRAACLAEHAKLDGGCRGRRERRATPDEWDHPERRLPTIQLAAWGQFEIQPQHALRAAGVQ